MKLYTAIPEKLKPFYQKELDDSMYAFAQGDYTRSWRHLERAHILGQRYPYAHSYVHWKMLCFGCKLKKTREILGQIPRLLVGGVKSFVGNIPVGNPGGANVPALKPFPIEADLDAIFREANTEFDS